MITWWIVISLEAGPELVIYYSRARVTPPAISSSDIDELSSSPHSSYTGVQGVSMNEPSPAKCGRCGIIRSQTDLLVPGGTLVGGY